MKKYLAAFAALAMMVGAVSVPSNYADAATSTPKARQSQSGVSFVYFGAKDCPSCRKFVSGYSGRVIKTGSQAGFQYVRKEVGTLNAILDPGSFGSYDKLQKAAMRKAGIEAVPLFAVVRDGQLVAAKAGDWKGMMNLAERMAH